MTPQFTTPCYVRIEDADKRKEVYEKLQESGYLKSDRNFIKLHKIIVARLLYIQTTMAFMDGRFIDCGTNVDLFLALAGMRSDTNKGQWFVCSSAMSEARYMVGGFMMCVDNTHNQMDNLGCTWRKAAPAEIIEHFNNK